MYKQRNGKCTLMRIIRAFSFLNIHTFHIFRMAESNAIHIFKNKIFLPLLLYLSLFHV